MNPWEYLEKLSYMSPSANLWHLFAGIWKYPSWSGTLQFPKNISAFQEFSSQTPFLDVDYAGSITNRRSTFGYCTFLGGNLVTWKSKKQDVVAPSSDEAEFRAMAQGICELLWLKIILEDLKIKWEGPMKLYCDNKSAISIAHNLVQHDRIKHIEVDRHFIKEKLDSGLICIPYVPSQGQKAGILTKGLCTPNFDRIICKLGMDNIYSPPWGGVLEKWAFNDNFLSSSLVNS